MTYNPPIHNPKKSNYNYKPKRSFKEKVKNFFSADIEKDLQEEESTKVFKRIKLFTLNRNNLFISLALFMIIINFLVGFNLNFFYIRQILSFLFIILVPGLLIMLCFKVRVKFWEYLVYTIGLSVAFIMFAGLAVNWTLPLLHITDKPLSLYPILICFNIFLIILGIVAWKRNKDLEHEFTTPKLDTLNNLFFIIPMFFPVLSILGAFLLNNHGPNILTMIMLGGIAVYALMLVIFRKRLNENIWPWALWMMGLSLLLMISLRSWYISGWDIYQEYYVFQIAKENFKWDILNFSGSYNSCLSITILPTIFYWILKSNGEYIFKLLFQLIFSLIPIGIYLLLNRYAKQVFAFMAGFLFISQEIFFDCFPKAIRLEIAFLFFTLMILILFNKDITRNLKRSLFIIFGFSMIVSHYSTSYIALGFFVLTYLIYFIFRKTKGNKYFSKIYKKINLKKKENKFKKEENYLSGVLVILLIIFSLLWLSQITGVSSDLVDFTHKTIGNLGKIFTEEVRADYASPFNQFNIFYKPKDLTSSLQNYATRTTMLYNQDPSINFYSSTAYKDYTPRIVYPQKWVLKSNNLFTQEISLFGEIIKKLIKIFLLIGIFYLLFFQFNRKRIEEEYIIMSFVAFFFLAVIMLLPFASIEYDLDRTYQQGLVILSLSSVLGGLVLLKPLKEKSRIVILAIIFIFYILFISGFIPQIVGGTYASMQLNNLGFSYSSHYSHEEEIKSINWFYNAYNEKDKIFGDQHSALRLLTFGNFKTVFNSALPSIIDKNSYVYLRYSNVIEKLNYKLYGGDRLIYNFPIEFLNGNKNKIYNNGGSEIFK